MQDYIQIDCENTTVMFANLTGFSSMSGSLSPVQITSLMNNCISRMEVIIGQNGGSSNKYIGDSFMATFEPGQERNVSEYRAIDSAIKMREEIYRFNEEHKLEQPVSIHIGIESGPSHKITGNIQGKKEYSDYSNLALRLANASINGQILVGISAYEGTKNHFIYRTIKPLTIKDNQDQMPVFEVFSTKENLFQSKLHFKKLVTSRIIGRKVELEILDNEISNTIKGIGSIISIIGEAGIGKTRLIGEFKKSKIQKKVNCLEGKSISIGRNLSFHPILDIINNWTGIEENDTNAVAFNKLNTSVKKILTENEDEILPFMCILLGIDLPQRYTKRLKNIEGEALEKLIIKTASSIMIESSLKKPLVLIFEDIHWADNSSLDLIESLFWLVKEYRVTFILLTRPGHGDTGDRIIKSCREKFNDHYTELELTPFNEKECEQMIGNFINITNLPSIWRERIINRSSGYPYFIEEVILSLIDNRALEFRNNIYEVTNKINETKIPYSLNELLLTRIERLDDETKNLLINASVIGKNFLYKVLKEISGGIDNIDTRLGLLKKVELILEDTRSEEIEFFFKHALAQEAAYASILANKRKNIHFEVAQSIEKIFKNRLQDFYGMLAYHYSSAEKLEKAEEYMLKAGDEALKSSASSEAIHYYQEALDLYNRINIFQKDPEKIAALEKNLAIAFFNKGQYENALIYFDRALKYYDDGIPDNKLMVYIKLIYNFITLLSNLFFPIKKSSRVPSAHEWEIIKIFHKRLTIIAVLDPRRFFIESIYIQKMLIRLNLKKVSDGIGMFSSTSNTFSWTGISYRISKKILDYHRDDIPNQDKRTRLLYNFSDLLHNFLTGNWHNNKYDRELINENLKDGELFFSSVRVLWYGYIQLEQGFHNKTSEHINMLNSIGNIYNHDYTIALKYELHTRFLIKYRELGQAIKELNDGIAFTKNADVLNVCFVLLALQVRAYALLENFDEAEKYLKTADEIKMAIYPVPFHLSYYMISKFTLYYNRFRKAVSANNRAEIQKLRNEINVIKRSLLTHAAISASDRVEAYRLVSNFYYLTGKYVKAFKYLRKSLIEGEKLNARVELARTYLYAGRFLTSNDNHYKEINRLDGLTYIEKSRDLFEKTGMEHDLKELRKWSNDTNQETNTPTCC